MDEKGKERQMDRYRRSLKRLVGYEEGKQRKAEAHKRKAARGSGKPRERVWDDDVAFEKIKRTRAPEGARLRHPGVDPAAGLPHAVVAEVHQGHVRLDNGEGARVSGRLLIDPAFRLAVGDVVAIAATAGPARIEALLPRRTYLSRPDPGNPHRELVLAANVDVAVIVVAAKDPPLRQGFIDRVLLALDHGGVTGVVCINKFDLLDDQVERLAIEAVAAEYVGLGIATVCCSAAAGTGIDALRRSLAGRTGVFVGHSGVGKSSLLNAIDPEGERKTNEVRDHDGRGRHTTTSSSLRILGDGTRIIDTPGVRAFGLDATDPARLQAGFPEFATAARTCRFRDCTHDHEPDCGVRAGVESGTIARARYASYLRILHA